MKLYPALVPLILVLAACGIISTPLLSQQVTFEALVTQRTTSVGDPIRLTFKLSNADGSAFVPPVFSGFQAEGPAKGFRQTNINGRISSEQTYTYTLIPLRTGTLTIGSASISVGRRSYTTTPITITVKPAAPRTESDLTDYFLGLEIDTTRALYVGQGIPIAVRLYTSTNIKSYQLNALPDLAGAYLESLDARDEPVGTITRNGKQYATKVIYRGTLYPQRSGTLDLPPISARLGIETSFFDFRVVVSRTRPVQLRIRSLPTPIPDDFSGAVGAYTFSSHLDPLTLRTGETLRWQLEVAGPGDPKRINPPQLHLSPDSFEVYQPTIHTSSYPDAEGLTYVKTFEYLVAPRAPGLYTPRPTFTYFDTRSQRYETLHLTEQPLTITPGTSSNASLSANGGLASLQPIITDAPLRRQSPLWGTPLFWLLVALTPLSIAIAWWMQYRQSRPLTPKAQHQRILTEAQHRLQVAHAHWQANQPRDFYDAISRALLQYLTDQSGIPAHALTRSELLEHVEAHYGNPTLTRDLDALLQSCEMALYAGLDHALAMPDIYTRAQSWLDRAAAPSTVS